ncbi:transposase [Shewanella salipaludis]|uniref:Transposase n=1 Tax=Shewanella salipaludis TaxID=2723052 RepID=A0A972G142_9GAMM|nr:transposase [Shewanella salipaludis]NMH65249.1 transposase [Shewanella salipaludis]
MGSTENNIRLKVIAAVKADGRLLSDVARQYGLSSKTVYLWVRESEQAPKQREAALLTEIAHLQQKIRLLNNELNAGHRC